MTVSVTQPKIMNSIVSDEAVGYQFSVVVSNTDDTYRRYQPMLNELVAKAVEPNIFYEPWVVLPALEAYSSGVDMTTLLVMATSTQDGSQQLVGFFPMESRKSYRGLPIHHLSLWRYPHCFLSTPILHRLFVRECIEVLVRWFLSQRGISLMELHLQSAHCDYYRQLKSVLDASPLNYSERTYERAFLNIGPDSETYLRSAFTSKFRHENRRRFARLQELGDLRWEEFPDGGSVDPWISDFLKLEASGWKGVSGTAMNLNTKDRTFFQQMVTEAFNRGRLYILALRLNGNSLAMIVVLMAEGGAYAFKHSYDENYKRYAPGQLMFVELIRRIHDCSPIRWLDSCTASDNEHLNKMFIHRKSMCNIVIAKNHSLGSCFVKAFPAVVRARHMIVNHRSH